MAKKATTVEAQIALLRKRGMLINDDAKAREVLLDIGYYRLCFYAFPFEKSYPKLQHRKHEYEEGVTLEDVVALYYFDFDLRKILTPYLMRIEVAFRTYLTYIISNQYKDDPYWFVNRKIVNRQYIKNFYESTYKGIRENPVIERHHKGHPQDTYAPAWKTIEFMMFGQVTFLFKALLQNDDKRLVSDHFGVCQSKTFTAYMDVVRIVRNACAHGAVLFDYKLPQGITNGPAGAMHGAERQNLTGMLKVVDYLLRQVSSNRANDMQEEITNAYTDLASKSATAYQKVSKITGRNK